MTAVKAIGKSGVKLLQPLDEFFGRFDRRKARFLADEIYHRPHVLDLYPAERVIEQQIVIEFE